MSNVKVNGNTYNGVTSVKLALADGTGYATYSEGMVTSDITNDILSGSLSGDYENSKITRLNTSFLQHQNVGTLSFPNAVTMFGMTQTIVTAENLLLPKVAKIEYRNNTFCSFRATITGVLDLSGMESAGSTLNQVFMGSKIETLKIGKMSPANMMFSNATITNLIWNNTDTTADKMGGAQGLGCSGATFTNAYVPDGLYDEIKALMDAGTLTTVTNLYKISEWSDE